MNCDPNDIIRGLVESWCRRNDYGPLALILPAWINNNGLRDGLETLHDALKHAYAMCKELPTEERSAIKQAYVAVEAALHGR